MSSWFDTRPWLQTWGDIAPIPHTLEISTPLRDLAATVAARGDEVAVSYYGFEPTWSDFDRQSTAFAAYLFEQGIGRGDRVGIYDQNTPAFMVAVYGIWKAGGVVVPLNRCTAENSSTSSPTLRSRPSSCRRPPTSIG